MNKVENEHDMLAARLAETERERDALKTLVVDLYRGLLKVQETAARSGGYLVMGRITEPLIYGPARAVVDAYEGE